MTTAEQLTLKAQSWDREREQALGELEQVEARAGADMIDDPSAGETLAGRVASLRARADLAGRAAAEARRRAQDARVASILAEAEALMPEVAKARKALEQHQKQRDELTRALENFTGQEWQTKPDPDIALVGSYTRATRPEEMLSHELETIVAEQDRLRAEADAAAADPDWTPPREREQARLRAEWDALVAGYREWVHGLADAREEITTTARGAGVDLDDLTHVPPWLTRLRERVDELEGRLQGFPRDVELYRGQCLDLGDDEVSALMAELGLSDELEPAAVG